MSTLKNEELLSATEVAEMLNVHPITIGKWLREGTIKGSKLGKIWRVKRSEVEAFFERSSNTDEPDAE